jgi:hypothetical protein
MKTIEGRSLLLFFETRAVDHAGRVKTVHMNEDDMALAKRWDAEGFVRFGRIASEHLNDNGTHWCHLSDEAWGLVSAERKARAARMWESRRWTTTEEKRAA